MGTTDMLKTFVKSLSNDRVYGTNTTDISDRRRLKNTRKQSGGGCVQKLGSCMDYTCPTGWTYLSEPNLYCENAHCSKEECCRCSSGDGSCSGGGSGITTIGTRKMCFNSVGALLAVEAPKETPEAPPLATCSTIAAVADFCTGTDATYNAGSFASKCATAKCTPATAADQTACCKAAAKQVKVVVTTTLTGVTEKQVTPVFKKALKSTVATKAGVDRSQVTLKFIYTKAPTRR